MSVKEPKVITRSQAKKQISTFAFPLFFYILLNMLLYRGFPYLSVLTEKFPFLPDSDYLALLGNLLVLLIYLFFVFPHVNNVLQLNIKDYTSKPKISVFRWISLISLGIGISLITVSAGGVFSFLTPSSLSQFPFLGSFTSLKDIIKNVLYFIVMVLVRPYCEEYMFRGTIQRQLGHYGRYFGVLASAVLYTFVQPDLVRAIPGFFIGWYLSLLTLRYHSIIPSFVVSTCLALLWFLFNVLPAFLAPALTVVIILVYIICAFSLFSKKVSTALVRYGATEWRLWQIFLSTPSVILCIIAFLAAMILSFLI